MRIQVLVTVISALTLFSIQKRFRRGAMGIAEALLWALLWIGAVIVVWNPVVSNRFAGWLGVGRGADAVLYSAVVILLYALLRLHARIEGLEHALSELVKKIALTSAGISPADKKTPPSAELR